MDEIILRAGYLDNIEAIIRDLMGGQNADALVEKDKAQKDLIATDKEIDSVFQLHTEMSGNSEIKAVIREKLEKLAERKRALTAYLEAIETRVRNNQDAKDARSVIENKVIAFKRGWKKSSEATQKRLIRRLIDTLIYTPEGLKTYYVTAKDVELDLPVSKSKKASESSSGAIFANSSFQPNLSTQPGVSFLYAGSLVGRASGGGGSRTLVQTCDGKSATCLATRFVLLP